MRTSAIVTALILMGGATAGQSNRAQPVGLSGPIQTFDDTASLAVDAVTLNFFPASRPLRDPRRSGRQFVRVAVTITNTGKDVFSVTFTRFSLQASDFTRHSTTSSINRGNSTDRLESTKLAPAASVSGALYYEVPASETRGTLVLVYDGSIGTVDKDFLFPLEAPGVEGLWVMDEARTKAAKDGHVVPLMRKVTLAADGTFTAGAGVTGKYTFDGRTLVVTYSGSPGLERKGGIDGAWLKFPAPAAAGRFCYMKRP